MLLPLVGLIDVAEEHVQHIFQVRRLPVPQVIDEQCVLGRGIGIELLHHLLDHLENLRRRGHDQTIRAVVRGHRYLHPALLLLRRNRRELALDLLKRAAGANPDLLLTRAIVLGLADQNSSAERAVKEIESQWPEWDRPYLVHGLLLERSQPRAALQKLGAAIALGSTDPAARCALARLNSAAQDPQCSCAGGLYELLFPSCVKP